MTWGDINSGAVPQPGGVVYRGDGNDSSKTVQEEVAQATQDALNFEGAFESVKAGIQTDDEVAVTQPVVEKDDEEASGSADGEEGEDDRRGYIPVTEADDQAASDGTGNERVPGSESSSDSDDSDDSDEDKAPAKSASKKEWAEYAGLSEEEADSMTKDEIIEKYGK
jgi:hypothetical protein